MESPFKIVPHDPNKSLKSDSPNRRMLRIMCADSVRCVLRVQLCRLALRYAVSTAEPQ